jgi:septal ring factor EnvC (AmiA/AmiB activator)
MATNPLFYRLARLGLALLFAAATPAVRAQDPLVGEALRPTQDAVAPAETTGALAPALEAPAGEAAGGASAEARVRAREAELESIRRFLQVSEKRQAALKGEVAAIEADRAALSADLLRTAERMRQVETGIEGVEARLADLYADEEGLRRSLRRRRAVLADVLAALQRMGGTPPPALLARPDDAVGAIRGSILASSVVPVIRNEAEALAADLRELAVLRERITAERDSLETRYAALGEERLRIDLLVASKRELHDRTRTALAAEETRAAELAAKAGSLEALITTLERELEAAAGPAAEGADRAATEAPRDAAEAARRLADPSRIEPAVAFEDAHGLLPIPVAGKTMLRYGEDDGLGGHAQGLSIAAEPGARVVSPADGWVVYAGPFRSYGHVLILNAGGGYHIVLAGMERTEVSLGQFVLAGEPVAVMGAKRLASLDRFDQTSASPVLYVEFRKDGAAIDPGPWWGRREEDEVRG